MRMAAFGLRICSTLSLTIAFRHSESFWPFNSKSAIIRLSATLSAAVVMVERYRGPLDFNVLFDCLQGVYIRASREII